MIKFSDEENKIMCNMIGAGFSDLNNYWTIDTMRQENNGACDAFHG